jgi:hypothetical protein
MKPMGLAKTIKKVMKFVSSDRCDRAPLIKNNEFSQEVFVLPKEYTITPGKIFW